MLLYQIVLSPNINGYSTYYHLPCDINLVMECEKDPQKINKIYYHCL